jgi:chromosome segregation ATPase
MSQDTTTSNTGIDPRANVQALVNKIVELQDKLVESQEKNLILATQLREMEMMARDGQDLKAELENQSAMLADKTRENKQIHQDLARVTTVLEEKLKDLEETKMQNTDLLHQLRQRESERDLLAVMLTEKEKQDTNQQRGTGTFDREKDKGWFDRFKK